MFCLKFILVFTNGCLPNALRFQQTGDRLANNNLSIFFLLEKFFAGCVNRHF